MFDVDGSTVGTPFLNHVRSGDHGCPMHSQSIDLSVARSKGSPDLLLPRGVAV